MSQRRVARRTALQLLYQAEIWGGPTLPQVDVSQVLSQWEREFAPRADAVEYVRGVVEGVSSTVVRLDALIADYAIGWAVERMAVVDKNILRLALFEMVYRSDIPWQVAVNEAVELAKRYATPDTASFVNGICAAVQRDIESGELSPPGKD
jgi:N utilization substance protein B